MAEQLDRLKHALADRYTVERELGTGGMATVYLATDVKHKRRVAIKVVRPELAAVLGPERFLREIEITAQLNHPHILPLLDSGEAGGFLYYAMPYAEGESLRERLLREKQLPIEDALQIAREVADALDYAHQHQVIHRDIKPENILLEGQHAVVADFGIARAISVVGGEKLTATGVAVGTPEYMSPEQAGARGEVDKRSDVYALGCVLYEMLAGQPPFTGVTVEAVVRQHLTAPIPAVTAVRAAVPASIAAAIQRSLAKAPADRFRDAASFAIALQGVTSAGVAPGERDSDVSRGRQAALVTGGLALVAVLAVLVARWRSGSHAPVHSLSSVAVLPFTNQTGDSALGYFVDGMHSGVIGQLSKAIALIVKSGRSVTRYRNSRKSMSEIGDELGVGALVEAEVTRIGDSVGLEVHLVQAQPERELWSQRFGAAVADVYRMYGAIADSVVRQVLPRGVAQQRAPRGPPPSVDPAAYRAFLRGEQANGTDLQALIGATRKAIAALEQAVELDPRFAEAHARLAIAYATLALNDATSDQERLTAMAQLHADRAVALDSTAALGYVALARHAEVVAGDLRRGLPYLHRALELEPGSDEVLVELLWVYLSDCDYSRGVELGTKALQLNPFNGMAAFVSGIGYWGSLKGLLMASFEDPGHFDAARAKAARDSALRYLNRTIELSPDDAVSYMYVAYWYLSMEGDVGRASDILQRAARAVGAAPTTAAFFNSVPEGSRVLARDDWYRFLVEQSALGSPNLDSTSYYAHKAMVYDGTGNTQKARAYWDSVRATAPRTGKGVPFEIRSWELALAYAALGERTRAMDLANQLRGVTRNCWWDYHLALVEAMAGLDDAAVARLEDVALRQPMAFVTPKFLSLDPGLRALRANPRFRKLLAAY